jgi:transposase, IS605 OrfB family, central region
MRQLAPLFGVSKSAADRIIDHLGPMFALQPRKRFAKGTVLIVDGTRDFHHRPSTMIVRENQAVYVEDLAVKGLARTRLAKSVHDAGWSAFVSMLEYKTARYGRVFARVDRFFPSSRLCSACGFNDGPKDVSGLRDHPRPRRERRGQHQDRRTQGRRRTGGDRKRQWSAGMPGIRPGTAR